MYWPQRNTYVRRARGESQLPSHGSFCSCLVLSMPKSRSRSTARPSVQDSSDSIRTRRNLRRGLAGEPRSRVCQCRKLILQRWATPTDSPPSPSSQESRCDAVIAVTAMIAKGIISVIWSNDSSPNRALCTIANAVL